MSFMLTTDQIMDRSKTVTRRLGWELLKPGDILNACEKCMGLKPGEKIKKLSQIRVVSVRREPLKLITMEDVLAEGFPGMYPDEFVLMFCGHMKCDKDTIVTRIEFEYL